MYLERIVVATGEDLRDHPSYASMDAMHTSMSYEHAHTVWGLGLGLGMM